MHLRSVAAVIAIVLAAAACADGTDTEPADSEQAVEESASTEAVDEIAGAPVGDDAEDASVADGPDAAGEDAAADRDAEPGTVDALWWTAETVADGSSFVAGDLAGEHVVLWLWAPWCSVCNREAPEVADALGDLPSDVTLIGVAGRDDVGPMRDFVAEHDLGDITHVVDADGAIWSSYGISYQPAWVFIAGDGDTSVAAGALGRDGLFEGIEQVFGS